MRATTSLMIGTILAVGALILFGLHNYAWLCVVAMAVFSIGEIQRIPRQHRSTRQEDDVDRILAGTRPDRGRDPAQVTEASLPADEAFHKLVEFTGENPDALTSLLYQTYNVSAIWYFFACVGWSPPG